MRPTSWLAGLLLLVGAESSLALKCSANTVAPQNPGDCLSIGTTCVEVPVTIARTDNTDLRGFSVTFTLSPELQLCGGSGNLLSIVEGDYLSEVNPNTQVYRTGTGPTYTIDCAILGTPCGADAASGTLFAIQVERTVPTGTGTVTINSLRLRDCSNGTIASAIGGPAAVTIDAVAPVAVSNLATTQDKTANGGDGLTDIVVNFTPPGDAAVVEVYRKGFGSYPEYDDCGATAPAVPGYPPAGWTLTGVTAGGQSDQPPSRDFWYYAVFTKDACGNVSSASNLSGGSLSYHLGDVADGINPPPAGNNLVNGLDISELGNHYGITLTPSCGSPFAYLDVGPTTDFTVDARPLCDDLIDFEDLILFAINFNSVSRPAPRSPSDVAIRPSLRLEPLPVTRPDELLYSLTLSGNQGTVKGVHTIVAYEREALELLTVERAGLAADDQVFFAHLSAQPGTVIDLARLGQGLAFDGDGPLATLRFRVKRAGWKPSLLSVSLRDPENRTPGTKPIEVAREVPEPAEPTFAVQDARPNPFTGRTEITLRLPSASEVELAIYDAAGRQVRRAHSGQLGAGEHTLVWDGRTDLGAPAGPGVYFYALRTGGREITRKLLLIK
ncbi:MAG: T9SS type A sorting domain-containing protein [Candidatus Eisenbacteria bacterium]|nr:T9SS type A sorting domain-containing protein [Candidatus Eisenbacteria bacterium]